MSASAVDVLRVNNSVWSFESSVITIDGEHTTGMIAIDWTEERETITIPSNAQAGLPLGIATGAYRVAHFPMKFLLDSGLALLRYLSAQAAADGFVSYSDATFTLGVQLHALDSATGVPSTTVFAKCRILGVRRELEDGEAVIEFKVGTIGIATDGNTVYDSHAGGPTDPWPSVDTITIAGVQAPGRWILQPGSKVFGWEERVGMYQSGATVVPKGDELVKADFLVWIWDPKDYLAWNLFRAVYLTKALIAIPGGIAAMALGIDHPELTQLGCSSVVVRETPWLTNDGNGVWVGTVKFLQYRRPQPALSKPKSAIPDTVAPEPTATDAAEAALAAATADLAALGGP